MKAKILKILGCAFDPEIAEMKADEIITLIERNYKKRDRKKGNPYDLNRGGFKNN